MQARHFSLLLVLLAIALLPMSTGAENTKVERTFRGKIVVLKKRPPMSFPSQAAWIKFLRSNKMDHIWPDKDNQKQWKFEFMAFFNGKLNDVEVNVKFYDVTEEKKFIAADSYYLDRGQTIFASNMVLEQPRFEVNRKYQMFILSARTSKVLASTIFWLRGKGEVYSGRVTFSDEDTREQD